MKESRGETLGKQRVVIEGIIGASGTQDSKENIDRAWKERFVVDLGDF